MKRLLLIFFLSLLVLGITAFYKAEKNDESNILSYQVNPKEQNLKFYWKNSKGQNISSLQNLKQEVESSGQKLIFAMNGGMFKKGFIPQGLYVEEGELKTPVDTLRNGYGNFYLQPNGIFIITKDNNPVIIPTDAYLWNENIKFATQSGPMLLVDGNIHNRLTQGSKNVHIRNGVGILPNGDLLFAMSKERINFYDFATYFKSKGCTHALYLDGFVSRTYLPSQNWAQLGGKFGVIIGVTE